jgi:hypothetical protein
LSQLIGAGYSVYHDVPFEGWNIDHVLVGPAGVFSIETKTRRKPLDSAGGKQFQVVFTGKELQWPRFTDGESVAQAVRNGRQLSQWLGSAVGEPVGVIPVLTVPGRMVERRAPPNGLYVLNPKEIGRFCRDRRAVLDGVMMQRICHQLDQKCRLVPA